MKKIFLLMILLVASLFCTACINNLAIQELNQMGKEYLDKGDYDNAISRFQSCIDLNDNIFETRYNLGVAYIEKKDYLKASENLEYAIKLNPDNPDVYFSSGVAYEGLGLEFEQNPFDDSIQGENNAAFEPTFDEITSAISYLQKAISMYEQYLKISPKAPDGAHISSHIKELENSISNYCGKFQIDNASLCPLDDGGVQE